MLIVDGVTHRYGRRQALSAVALTVGEGVTGLVGENGAGKTTLLSLCAGLFPPSAGSVTIGEASLSDRRSRRAGLARVALMPQSSTVPSRMNALDFVAYLTWMRAIPYQVARRRAGEALERVGLSARMDERMGQYSGGMQRRVWLAQALAAAPDVLLLDEPSTGLDPIQRSIMLEILGDLPNTAVLLSSHIVEDVARLASRLVVLAGGHIMFDGPTPAGFDSEAFQALAQSRQP